MAKKKFRIWVCLLVEPKHETFYVPVTTMQEAIIGLGVLAEMGVRLDISNASGLEEFNEETQEWEEWYDNEGYSLEEYWDFIWNNENNESMGMPQCNIPLEDKGILSKWLESSKNMEEIIQQEN